MLADILLKTAGMTAEEQHPYYPRPSIAGPERCIRQMVMWGLGVEPDHDLPDRMVMVWDDGRWHEELTNDWIRQTTYRLHSEQMKIDVKPPMTKGSIDGIITDTNGEDTVFDHKAINHFTFQRFWNGDETPDDYFSQLAIYCEGLQRTANRQLKNVLLLIKNKNTAQYMEYFCHYEIKTDTLAVINRMNSNGEFVTMNKEYPNIVSAAVKKFELVAEYIKKKTLPRRQYYKDSWRCKYCYFMNTCWEGYEEEQSAEPTELPEALHEKVEIRKRWKKAESSGKKAYDEIMEYMRLNNLLVAKSGSTTITRKLTKTGDRFSFKEE